MTENTTESRKNPFNFVPEMFGELGLDSFTDRFAAMGEAQTRQVKHMTEQMLGYGRQLGEHVNNQMQVTAKLYKDGLDYSINLWDTWNKVILESTEHALDNMVPRK
ncbi:MAG: hypothetical protein ABIJ09_07485 [Pseudomonadota bacterium]